MIPHEEEKKVIDSLWLIITHDYDVIIQVVGPRHMLKYTGPINRALVEQGVKRTSNLLAPIMLLEGISLIIVVNRSLLLV